MSAPPTAHPDPARLAAYGAGRLTPAEAGAVEEHLHGCAACGERMDELARDPFLSALRDAAAFDPPNGSGCAADAPTVACFGDPQPIPDELATHPRYRLGELLGRGGMGAVYKAEHTLMERPVAIKLIDSRLLEQPGAAERFKAEVKTAAKLHHPNIVTAHDAEQFGSITVLVMEFVEGRTLADVLRAGGPLPVAEACGYAIQAAVGLAHAHALGMVHRDVKPHNLMLTPDGRVKILDFGLARFLSEGVAGGDTRPGTETGEAPAVGRLTQTGACMGTLDYMAPEQARDARAADARADVYSLGGTLYHLLAGQAPFAGGTGSEKLHRIRTEEPAPLSGLRPDVPPELGAAVGRMMAKSPEERYASAADVADALARFTRAAEPRPAAPRGRRKFLAACAALVLAGVAVAAALSRPAARVAADPEHPEDKGGPGPAGPPAAPGPQLPPLPTELDLIPRHAAGFVSVRVRDLTRIPSQAWVWKDENDPRKDRGVDSDLLTGVRLDGLVRATVIWPTAERPDPNIENLPPEVLSRLLVLTTAEPFPPTHPALAGPGRAWEVYRGRRYALDGVGWTACFQPAPHTLVIGTRASVRYLLDHLADPVPGPLDDAVRLAAEAPGPIAVGMSGRPFAMKQLKHVPWLLSPPAPFPGVPAVVPERLAVALDCRKGVELDVRAGFATADAAEEGRAALAGLCAHHGKCVAQMVRSFGKEVDKLAAVDPQGPNSVGTQLYRGQVGFYSEFAAALAAAAPQRDGTTLRLTLRTKSTLAFEEALAECVAYAYSPYGSTPIDDRPLPGRDAAVAAALAAYRAEHGRFPPPAVTDAAGKPLLSWRVAVLPYLGAEAAALYRRFRLTEPWDSAHNRPLIDAMPAVFSTEIVVMPVRLRPRSGYRIFAEPAGKGGAEPRPLPAGAVVAVREYYPDPHPWTKPDAASAADMTVIPAAVILTDGSAHPVPYKHDLAAVRAALVGRTPYPKPPEPPAAPVRPMFFIDPPPAARPVEVAPAPRPVKPIPPELDLIPRDAAGFLTVPVQEVLTAPALAWARKRLFSGGELAEMVKMVTMLDLKDITRATVIWPTADHIGWNVTAVPGEIPSRLVVLTSAHAIGKTHPEYSSPEFRTGKGTEEYRGRRYMLDSDGWMAFFVADDHTVIFGSRVAVRLVIDRLADPKPGPLDGAVRTAADGPKRVVIGVQGPKVRRVLADNIPPQLQLAAPAYTADRVTVAIDLRDELTIDFLGMFATEAATADGHAALVKAFAAGAEELDVQVGKLPPLDATDPERLEEQKMNRDFVTQTRDALKRAKPERIGTQLRLTFVSRSGFLGGMVLPGITYVLMPTGPTHFDPAVAGKNDATVAKALLAYHAKHGRFPPPAILSKEGKPLLSWRVALLPHLGDEAAALYKKFNLEEAWDSPANKKLLDQMPAELCTDPFKTDYRPRPRTGYRVYTAKGSVFEGPGGLSNTDITDDPAATILAVRFMQPVPWTKPDQLTFDNLEAIPSAAIFADGAVRRLAEGEDPNALKAMITRAGGENVKTKSDPVRPLP